MKREIQKNLYDLEYNRILNQQNMVFILIGTFIIGIILSGFSIKIKLLTIFVLFWIIFYSMRILNKKLKNIEISVKEL